ncbi:MAG: FmdB family zinc ribbon protein [Desulfobacterales bacterium]
MPTYEYRCEKCKKQFSAILSISEHDKAKVQCPKCKSSEVVQLVSRVSTKTSSKS